MTTKFSIPCPEIGPDTKIEFTFSTLEKLELAIGGANYLDTIVKRLGVRDPKIIRMLLEEAITGNTSPRDSLLDVLPVADLCERFERALFLKITGHLRDALFGTPTGVAREAV